MRDNGPRLIKPKGSENLYSTISPAANSIAYSEVFSLIDLDIFALQYQIDCTGTPNVKLELEQSTDNANWFTPDTFADLNPSITDQNVHGLKLSPLPVEFMRIKATELTTTVSDTVVTIKVSVQKRYTV